MSFGTNTIHTYNGYPVIGHSDTPNTKIQVYNGSQTPVTEMSVQELAIFVHCALDILGDHVPGHSISDAQDEILMFID